MNDEPNTRTCYICRKEFEGYITPIEAIEKFKEENGYMPTEDEYVEICKDCAEEG